LLQFPKLAHYEILLYRKIRSQSGDGGHRSSRAHEISIHSHGPDETHPDRLPIFSTPVEKYSDLYLTGPVKRCVLFIVDCSAQNPSADMRGGFLRWGFAIKRDRCHSPMRDGGSGNDEA
jgi:hypothetical protein